VGAAVHAADDPLLEQLAGLAGNSPVGLLARALPKQRLGTVTDLLLTEAGAVRAVLVDVGRFVGSTGKVVAVPIEAVVLAGDPADPARRILLLAATRDSLQRAPAYEGAGEGAKPLAMTPASGIAAPGGGTRLPLAAAGSGSAAATPDGYRQAAMSEVTPQMLRSVDVYGSGGERIGAVRSVMATDSGIITALVVDMGGMLGFGGKAVALPMHEVTVLRRTDGKGLRVRTSASRAQLQAMPRHRD
ncbi:PRC-barrel domain-containing protein, partial [Marinibaculum pumilum]